MRILEIERLLDTAPILRGPETAPYLPSSLDSVDQEEREHHWMKLSELIAASVHKVKLECNSQFRAESSYLLFFGLLDILAFWLNSLTLTRKR